MKYDNNDDGDKGEEEQVDKKQDEKGRTTLNRSKEIRKQTNKQTKNNNRRWDSDADGWCIRLKEEKEEAHIKLKKGKPTCYIQRGCGVSVDSIVLHNALVTSTVWARDTDKIQGHCKHIFVESSSHGEVRCFRVSRLRRSFNGCPTLIFVVNLNLEHTLVSLCHWQLIN